MDTNNYKKTRGKYPKCMLPRTMHNALTNTFSKTAGDTENF